MSSPDYILAEGQRQKTYLDLVAKLAELFRPKPRWNIWQWAEHRRFIAQGVSAKTLEGPKLYNSADAPHQRKPQESATDPKVRVTVLIMASQIGGKTEIFNNVAGYHMDHEPRNCVIMYPTLDAAEKYSKKKFTPMVEASPALSRIVRPARSRYSGNTILSKDFAGGSVYFVGSNSTPSLRATSGAVLLADEIDSNELCAGVEGDPVELLFKRGESYPNVVKMLSSTPTIKGLSAIWEWWEESDMQFWFVPCPKCGNYQILKWWQIKWPEGDPERAFMVCALCDAGLSDADRLKMYFEGQWRATAPFKGIAGFHLNGIYAPWPAQKGFANRLHMMAVDFLRAKKSGEMKERVWVNTFLCELWEEKVDELDYAAIYAKAESYSPDKVPEDVIMILAAVDVQKRWLELEVIGLGLDDETWGIEHIKVEGDTEQDDVWQDLAGHLQKKYRRIDGAELPITATAIDMRHKPEKVRKFVQRAGIPRVFPVYGIAGLNQVLLISSKFSKRYRLRTFAINGRIAKDILFARLRVEDPGPRFMHFPEGQGYDAEFFKGLTAEVLKRSKSRGVIVERYEKIRDRNEPIDLRQYFLAAVDILKPNLTATATNIKASLEKTKPTKPRPPDQGDISSPGQKPKGPPPAASSGRRRLKLGDF